MAERNKTFTLRLTPEQHTLLEEGATKEGLSKNQYLTKLIERHNGNQNKILSELSEIKQLIIEK